MHAKLARLTLFSDTLKISVFFECFYFPHVFRWWPCHKTVKSAIFSMQHLDVSTKTHFALISGQSTAS